MCMRTVEKCVVLKEPVLQYKAFGKWASSGDSYNLHLPYFSRPNAIPLNVWIQADPVRHKGEDDNATYYTGFHAFESKEDAKKYLVGYHVLPVLLRGIAYYGIQSSMVIGEDRINSRVENSYGWTAQEMMVLEREP